MSFTTVIKNEIAKLDTIRSSKISELSGFIRNNISPTFDLLVTENVLIARRIYLLIKELYGVSVEIISKSTTSIKKSPVYLIMLPLEKKTFILEDLGVVDKEDNFIESPKEYLISTNDDIRAYLRGVFLTKGSVNDPKTSQYHMEILLDYPKEAIVIQRLLNQFDLNAKLLNRDKGYMIYLKEADKISDFLKILSASGAVLYFENIRIVRNHKNITNRLNNCEQANIDKVIETAQEQLHYIEIIKKHLDVQLLDEKIKEALLYRERYQEASLQELSEIITMETGKKITKSGLNHRFRKIKEMALKLENREL